MAVNMVNDIVSGHRARMLNLKKYYPFFKLTEISLSQFKDGKYEILDMGYIVMGILRFFIEENNFNEKDVTYPEYLEFFHELISRHFGLLLSEEEKLVSEVTKLQDDDYIVRYAKEKFLYSENGELIIRMN